MNDLIIIGASNPEIVKLVDAINRVTPVWKIRGFVVDNPAPGSHFMGFPVLGDFSILQQDAFRDCFVINAVARDTQSRKKVAVRLEELKARFATLVHPSVDTAYVGIGYDTIIYDGVILSPGVTIGNHCDILFNCVIAHETAVENFVFVAAGATINGRIKVNDGAYIGTNAMILPYKNVGAWSTVGAGAAVYEDVPPNATVAGNPATVVLSGNRSMNRLQNILERCKRLVAEREFRAEYLRELKKKSAGIIGYFSNYVPEEIIIAAGYHPVRMIGAFSRVDERPPARLIPLCSFVQDFYSSPAVRDRSVLDALVFPHSCDSLRALYDLWSHEASGIPAYVLPHPFTDEPEGKDFFARELRAFAAHLSPGGGHAQSKSPLRNIIQKYNYTRGLLRQLWSAQAENRSNLKYSELNALLTAGLILDRDEFNAMLEEALSSGQDARPAGTNIMVFGPLMDSYPLLEKIEERGAHVIGDGLSNGARYFERDTDTVGDEFAALAERYIRSGSGPTRGTFLGRDELERLIRDFSVRGVIFMVQKFCDPHIYHYLASAEILGSLGVNHLLIEIDHGVAAPSERELLRLESFIDVIGDTSWNQAKRS